MAKHYMATLVRGSTYVSQGVFYRKDREPVRVSEEIKVHLEKTAVDDVAVIDGNGGFITQYFPKFTFVEVKEEVKKKADKVEEVEEAPVEAADAKPVRTR
jgi:hypothetical protein